MTVPATEPRGGRAGYLLAGFAAVAGVLLAIAARLWRPDRGPGALAPLSRADPAETPTR